MEQNNSFIRFDNERAGVVYDQSKHSKYPLNYYNVINGEGIHYVSKTRSYYVYVYEGSLTVLRYDHEYNFELKKGHYASLCGDWSFCASSSLGKAIVIEVIHGEGDYPKTNYRAVDMTGGPIEEQGRLMYIDGCTDSLLIPPVKMGDPCLNHLHFPANIKQTPHTHPSHRIGVVAKGSGECITPFGNLPLTEGMVFVIKEWDGESYGIGEDLERHPVGTHCFNTYGEAMDVIAFHPDSDFGATDVNHPMINRTIVDGVPASQISDIQTKAC
jgi:hypothetical protein